MGGPIWVGVAVAAFGAVVAFRQALRRWRISRRAPAESMRRWCARCVPHLEGMSSDERDRFFLDMQIVLAEQSFEGVSGVEVTDELRWSFAAGVALLYHGRPEWEWVPRRSVLFLPSEFDDTYLDSPYAAYDGMVHGQGPILLSAPSTEEAWSDPADGSNVVLHEIAHTFDLPGGEGAAGMPSLLDARSAPHWEKLMHKEMRAARRGQSLLRPYASEGPEELFAVATEYFFEQPEAMDERHPELYEAMTALYQIDPQRLLVQVTGPARRGEADR